MRSFLFSICGVAALSFSTCVVAQTQGSASSWNAHPAFGEVQAIDASSGLIWAGANGGVFSYDPVSGEISRYTALDGLQGGELHALVWDQARNAVWVGYADGAIDKLDAESGDVTTIFDIARADRFAARGVRRLRVQGDTLYAATDFGVVALDPATNTVRNTFSRLSTLRAGVGANDIVHAPLADGTPGIWVATDEGLVSAPASAGNLQTPAAWTLAESFGGTAFSLANFQGRVYAGGGPDGALDVYGLAQDGTWARQIFSNQRMNTLIADGDVLLAQTFFALWVIRPAVGRTSYVNAALVDINTAAVGPGGTRWIGDGVRGIIPLPAESGGETTTFDINAVVPNGPFTNRIVDLAVARDGVVWAVSQGIGGNSEAAISRLDDGLWTNLRNVEPSNDFGTRSFRSIAVDRDGTAYAGLAGDGLVVLQPNGDAARYDESNSSLRSAGTGSGFVVVADVAFEGDLRWVANLGASLPLHVFETDGTWTALPFPSGIASSDGPVSIAIDRFDQKWLALGRNSGMMVWDTGSDPVDPSDDRGRLYRGESAQSGSGLPNGTVNDVVVDLDGRVWLGTSRGLAYVFSPGSAFGNDPGLAVPQWPIITENGTADYLLRDVTISDLELDPAGQLWVATTSGAYLVNTAGNAVIRHLTKANSLLPTDAIINIAVDGTTGDVYMNTELGLYVAPADARRPLVDSNELAVAPNPFRPAQSAGGVLISGLRDAQSVVRILTASGDAVYSSDVSGGAFRWDGRDERTGALVPSGVYIVAASGEQGGGTVYGKVAVIR